MNILKHETEEDKNESFDRSSTLTLKNTKLKFKKLQQEKWSQYRLRGSYSEGLIYGGKFAFQNRLGEPYSWKEIYRFCFVFLCIWGQIPIWRYDLTEGFLRYEFGVLIFGGAYTWRGLFSEFYRFFFHPVCFCFYLTPFFAFFHHCRAWSQATALVILNRETTCIDLYKGNWYKDRMAI